MAHTRTSTVTSRHVLDLCVPLVQSKTTALLERGVFKLSEFLRESNGIEKEVGLCALYHLALGHFKLGDERTAFAEVNALLTAKSFHTSALALKQNCIDKMISKQKSSGFFSRLMRKKDDSSSASAFNPATLTFLSEEERKGANEKQSEQDSALIASMTSPEGENGENEEFLRDSNGAERSFKFPVGSSGAVSGSRDYSLSLADPQSSSSSPLPILQTHPSQNSIHSNGPSSDGTGSDANDFYLPRSPSSPNMTAHSSVKLGPSSSLASMPAGSRGSAWLRSKPSTSEFSDLSTPGTASSLKLKLKPHESLPNALTKRSRPLRASQSQRTAPPSSSYLSMVTTPSSNSTTAPDSDDSESEEEDWEDEELEQALQKDLEALERSTFSFHDFTPSFVPGSGLYTDSELTSKHAAESDALAAEHKQAIDAVKQDYQSMLKSQQAEQYELLRVQQEEVSRLNAEQLALLEEEKQAMNSSADPSVLLAMGTRMKELTDRQAPLMEQQKLDQEKLVAEQGVMQKEKQDSFRALLVSHQQARIELASKQEQELNVSEQRALQEEKAKHEKEKENAELNFQGNLASKVSEKKEQLAQVRATIESKRIERERKKAEKAERKRIEKEKIRLDEENRRIQEEENRRIAEENRRIEEERMRAEQEEIRKREVASLAAAAQEEERLRILEEERMKKEVEDRETENLRHSLAIERERLRAESEANAQAIELQKQELERQRAEMEAQRKALEEQSLQLQREREAAGSPSLSSPSSNPSSQTPTSLAKAPSTTLPRGPPVSSPSGSLKFARPPPPKQSTPAPANPTDEDVIDVFALSRGVAPNRPLSGAVAKQGAPQQTQHGPPVAAGSLKLSRPAGAPPKAPLPSLPPGTAHPQLTKASSLNSPTTAYGPPGSALPPLPSGPPPPSSIRTVPPSNAPPARPPPPQAFDANVVASITAAPPQPASQGPPGSNRPAPPPGSFRPTPPVSSLPSSPGPPPASGPPPQPVPSSGGITRPTAGPPPMPNTANVPQSQRINYSSAPPPMPSTAPPPSRPADSMQASSFGSGYSSGYGGGSDAPPPASFYGPPPGSSASPSSSESAGYATSSLSDKERAAATSRDTTQGITKDKKGLPVSKTTHKGAHLLSATSKAKGPSRRPPSTMVGASTTMKGRK